MPKLLRLPESPGVFPGKWAFRARGAITLTVGIALPSLLYGLLHAVVLADLPVSDPARCALIYFQNPRQAAARLGGSGRAVQEILARTDLFDAATVFGAFPEHRVGTGEGADLLTIGICSDGLRKLAGVRVIAGRWFSPEEQTVSPPTAVVIGERFWRERHYAVGTTLFAPNPVTIVGVIGDPPIFALVAGHRPDLFLPAASFSDWNRPDGEIYQLLVHLRGGVPLRTAAAFIASFSNSRTLGTELQPRIVSLKSAVLGQTEEALWLLFAATVLVAIMSSANLAYLITLRIEERKADLGVRRALGASQLQILGQVLRDLLSVSALGWVGGLAIHYVGIQLIRRNAAWFDLPRLEDIAFGAQTPTVCFLLCLAVSTAAILMNLHRLREANLLAAVCRQASAGRFSRPAKFAAAMAGLQFAIALTLAYSAVVLGEGFAHIRSLPLGYDPSHVLAVSLHNPSFNSSDDGEHLRLHRELNSILRFVAGLPGVTAVTAAYPRPTQADFLQDVFTSADGRPGSGSLKSEVRYVAPNYFQALSIRILRGRGFDPSAWIRTYTAVVNQTFARSYPAGRDVIGSRIAGASPYEPGKEFVIVGLAADTVDDQLEGTTRPRVYVPGTRNRMDLLVRADQPDSVALDIVGTYIRHLDPETAVGEASTLDADILTASSRPRVEAALSLVFAISAIILAVVGLYGCVRYSAEGRRTEMAIKAALGATPGILLRDCALGILSSVAGGMFAGSVLILVLRPLLGHILVGVPAWDPSALLYTGAALSLAAAMAAYLAYRSAARLNPADLLRCN